MNRCALLTRLSSWPGLENSDSEEVHHGETDAETTLRTVGGAGAARKKRKTSSEAGGEPRHSMGEKRWRAGNHERTLKNRTKLDYHSHMIPASCSTSQE